MNIIEAVAWLKGGEDRFVSINGYRAVLNRNEDGLIWADTRKGVSTEWINSNDWEKVVKRYRTCSQEEAFIALAKGYTIKVSNSQHEIGGNTYKQECILHKMEDGIHIKTKHPGAFIKSVSYTDEHALLLNFSSDDKYQVLSYEKESWMEDDNEHR